MVNDIKNNNNKQPKNINFLLIFAILFFVILASIGAFSTFIAGEESIWVKIYGYTYGLMALFGAIVGFSTFTKWGGFKSLLGKAIFMLSMGLLFQEIGQLFYTYYIEIIKIDVPYPSLGDIGFFGSVIFYLVGAIYLYRVSGAQFSLKPQNVNGFIQALSISIITPILLLGGSYFIFLNGYSPTFGSITNDLKTLLDFGYPLFQALYLSIVLITLVLAKNRLGGYIKKSIIFLGLALFIQYLADFMFLYLASRQTWVSGGLNDLVYLCAYFLMTVAIIEIKSLYSNIKEGFNTNAK